MGNCIIIFNWQYKAYQWKARFIWPKKFGCLFISEYKHRRKLPAYKPCRFDSLKGNQFAVWSISKEKIRKENGVFCRIKFFFYSTKQQTGSFKDSSLTINNSLLSQTSNGFYQSGSLNTYHNKYYYLQIPLLLHWQINKGNKFLPLNWENGFAPSVLVGSNALAYDRSTRIFYKDKRVFNSFNLVYQTGLSARLVKDKKHPLNMGLYYNYHFSRLQKIAPPNYNYLSSYGIKLNWVIKK